MKNAGIVSLLFLLPMSLLAGNKGVPSFGVKIYGHGRPMILIPGLRGDGEGTYSGVVDHFRDLYTCYVITLAGFAGQRPSGRTSDVLMGQRDELLQYIKDQQMDHPVLVGFSFGGQLALWMASTEPDLFGPVIDLDGAPFDDGMEDPAINEDSLHKQVDSFIHIYQTASAQEIARRDSLRHIPAAERSAFQYLKNLITDTLYIPGVIEWDIESDMREASLLSFEGERLDLREDVARIKSPILVLGSWKGFDKPKLLWEAEMIMKQQFRKAKYVHIVYSKEGRHFFMWDDYDWMVDQMDQFLNVISRKMINGEPIK